MACTPPFDRIVFDCDSTLSRVEGIEELSRRDPALAETVASLTADAMEGRVPLEAVYGRRLELIGPRQLDAARIASRYVAEAVRGSRELVAALHSLGKEVHVVSGGLHLAVVSFAMWLGVRDEHVHAVKVIFDADGRYVDYDHDSPLAHNHGKRLLLASWPPARTAFVGDGITDAEVADAVDCFVCFAGVVRREEVAARAHAVVETPDMAALLSVLCSPSELDQLVRDPRHAALLRRAGIG